MTIEVAILLQTISVASAIYFAFRNSKKTDEKDVGTKAAETAIINVKLDSIAENIKEIKDAMDISKEDIKRLNIEVAEIRESTKNAHKRISEVMNRLEEKHGE